MIYFTKDKIVMASDSRVTFTAVAAPDDTVCKIGALHGQVLFASSGAGGYNGDGGLIPYWSNTAEAHEIADKAASTTTIADHIADIAETWATVVQSNFANLAIVHPDKIYEAEQMGKGVVTTGFFGGKDAAGKLVLYISQVTGTSASDLGHYTTEVLSCTTQDFCATGEVDIFTEFMDRKTNRAVKEAKTWRPPKGSKPADYDLLKAMRLVELTEKYQVGNKVGGPIDALEIDRDGSIRWFRRKLNCPEN